MSEQITDPSTFEALLMSELKSISEVTGMAFDCVSASVGVGRTPDFFLFYKCECTLGRTIEEAALKMRERFGDVVKLVKERRENAARLLDEAAELEKEFCA